MQLSEQLRSKGKPTLSISECGKWYYLVITIHQLLLTKAQKLAGSYEMCSLDCTGGAESPARTARTLRF